MPSLSSILQLLTIDDDSMVGTPTRHRRRLHRRRRYYCLASNYPELDLLPSVIDEIGHQRPGYQHL